MRSDSLFSFALVALAATVCAAPVNLAGLERSEVAIANSQNLVGNHKREVIVSVGQAFDRTNRNYIVKRAKGAANSEASSLPKSSVAKASVVKTSVTAKASAKVPTKASGVPKPTGAKTSRKVSLAKPKPTATTGKPRAGNPTGASSGKKTTSAKPLSASATKSVSKASAVKSAAPAKPTASKAATSPAATSTELVTADPLAALIGALDGGANGAGGADPLSSLLDGGDATPASLLGRSRIKGVADALHRRSFDNEEVEIEPDTKRDIDDEEVQVEADDKRSVEVRGLNVMMAHTVAREVEDEEV